MAEIVPLSDALANLVHDGDSVAMEGFTHLIPFAAGHELLRQGRRDLELIRMTPDILYDQMIGMGAARRLVFSYGGNPGVGSLHRFRDAIEHGWPQPLEIEEHCHAGMANRYAAGAAAPALRGHAGYRGTDLVAHTRVAEVRCPFTGERLTAVPALNPDVAHRSRPGGRPQLATCSCGASPACRRRPCWPPNDRWSPSSASSTSWSRGPAAIVIPGWVIDAVAQAPGGSRPSYSLGLTERDNDFYRAWDAISRDRDEFLAWMTRARLRRKAVSATTEATPGEVQTVTAARRLIHAQSVFIGVGRPSTAAILARMVHNPDLVLVYESGTIGAKPFHIPLSIGDGELAETADSIVSVPEMFNYWIGPGRIEVAFLGAAQIDRFANLNSTVIGDYEHPRTRLPGAGGAPEIAASCGEVIVIAPHSPRTLVSKLDFRTTVGHGTGPGSRDERGFLGKGPTAVITDLGVLEPDPETRELTMTALHAGVTHDQAREATGWDLQMSENPAITPAPTPEELDALRELLSR